MPDTYTTPLLLGDVMDSSTDSELLIKDVDDAIRLAGYKNRWLQAMCAKTKKKRTTQNREFFYMTDVISKGLRTVTSLAGTTLTVDSTSEMYANELYYNATVNEVIMILSIDSATTCTVRRDVPGTHATLPTWTANTSIMSLGTAYGENARIPAGHVKLPGMQSNYTQRFLYSIEISKQMLKEKSYLKNPRAYWNKKLLEEHLIREEYLALFGKKAVTTANASNDKDGGKVFLTGGLYEHITSHNIDLSGASLDEATFNSLLLDVFDEGSSEKMMLCSKAMAQRLESWGKNLLRYSAGNNKIGLPVTQYLSSLGVVDICPTGILDSIRISGSLDGDMIFFVDPGQVSRVIYKPTTWMPDMQSKEESISIIKDVYEGIYGWDPGLESTHCVVSNFI